jgi:hypothetical protein
MNEALIFGLFLLYIAIGLLANRLVGNDPDDFSMGLVVFWPLFLVAMIVIFFVVAIPCILADILKGERDD